MDEDAELIDKIVVDELLNQIATTDQPDIFLNAVLISGIVVAGSPRTKRIRLSFALD